MYDDVTGEDVLLYYIYAKNQTRSYHGLPEVDVSLMLRRARNTWLPACEKAAELCNKYHIDAVMWVDACFKWAKRNRFSDGPLPNCLGSEKYGLNALQYVFNIPKEAILKEFSIESLVAKREDKYIQNLKFLQNTLGRGEGIFMGCVKDINGLDTMTSIPVIDRYIASGFNREFFDDNVMEIVDMLDKNRVDATWAATRGVTDEHIDKLQNG